MRWPIQATVLILSIVTCTAQGGRGSRRFSATSSAPSQEAISDEEVIVKNHRFQARHGSLRSDVTTGGREFQSRRSDNNVVTPEVVGSTPRRSSVRGSGVDNDIIRSTSRSLNRQRLEPSTTRQYLSRNSRPNDNSGTRRRIDLDVSTEEVVTRGSVRTRNEKIRGSYNGGRTGVEVQESTTGQYRVRSYPTRERNNQEEKVTTSQTRLRNVGNIRQNESIQNRAGRGRSLAIDEPTTQSLRPRGRGHEKVAENDGKSGGRNVETFRTNRYNDAFRGSNRGELNDQKGSDSIVTTRTRSRVTGRRTNLQTEAPTTASVAVETGSNKFLQEDIVSSSEIPLESSSQEQPVGLDITQTLDVPLMQLVDAALVEDEKNGKKLFGESNLDETENISTARINVERTTKNSLRGRGRNLANNSRNRNGQEVDNENVNKNRNTGRFVETRSRQITSGRTTGERPLAHHGGRGRTKENLSEITTANYRTRNGPIQSRTNIEDHTLNAETLFTASVMKSSSEEPQTVLETSDEILLNDQQVNPTTISSVTTPKLIATSSNAPVTNILGRKLGRGTARASKTEVISCTCYTKTACNFVNCPSV